MKVPILVVPFTYWECPNCEHTDRTQQAGPHTRYHPCRGLSGALTAPMVRVGVRAKVVAVEREDYVGADVGNVQLDGDGRPVMSIVTTRDDGQDCAVLAPTATGSVHSG
jgi:hypothetical protein